MDFLEDALYSASGEIVRMQIEIHEITRVTHQSYLTSLYMIIDYTITAQLSLSLHGIG